MGEKIMLHPTDNSKIALTSGNHHWGRFELLHIWRTVGRYLFLWEIDPTRMPVGLQQRATAWRPLIEMVRQDMKEGKIKEWGVCVAELNGYSVAEGTGVEIKSMLLRFAPFVHFAERGTTACKQ